MAIFERLNDVNEAEELIDKVNEYLTAFESENTSAFKKYNLFNVLEVGEREVIMCRFSADLLKPNGMHGYGGLFLKSFLKSVCNITISDELAANTVVIKEYLIPKTDRRIDIVIQNPQMFLPIEVKIYAGEQKS